MRRIRTLALAVTCAAALAACGSGGGGDHAATGTLETTPLAAVRSAAQTTTDAKTAKVALTVTTSGSSAGNITVNASGVTDYANRSADITLDLGDLGGLAKEIPGGAGGLTFEERLVGDTVYMKLPSALTDLTGGSGKPWTKIDASKLGAGAGSSGIEGTDPSEALEYLNGVSDDVKKVGPETVRGVDTTHYTATLDLQKALAKAEQADPQAKATLDKAIGQLGTSTFPADIWIDGQGRLAKITYAITVPAAGQKVSVNYSMELYDFGTPVDVQAPPADQVGDGSGLLSGLTGGSTGTT